VRDTRYVDPLAGLLSVSVSGFVHLDFDTLFPSPFLNPSLDLVFDGLLIKPEDTVLGRAKMHTQVVHNAYTPKETTELCSRAGTVKANMRADKVFVSGFMAGALLALACACTLSVSVAPWFQENAPGVITLLGALIFPWGLTAILSTGTDLCTGSFMVHSLTSNQQDWHQCPYINTDFLPPPS
jgi:hypothetical protein